MGSSNASQPRIVGRYALYDKIAAGGMATVHLGRRIGPVGFARIVAVKRLHTHFAEDPEFVSMFLDEARLAARIHHPNVVPVVDVVAADGELLLVMDYVKGECLARLLRLSHDAKQTMPISIATTIMVGVLHGLHAAHEAKDERGEPLGIVHRDVSPQNVLVGVDGVARVVDFGVAKASGRVQTTREGQLKGKLAYMAPEQFRGLAARTTDVYAASVVLWEALAGRRLFSGENDAEILGQLMDRRIDPPSFFAPDVPPALDAIVLRGLSADPRARFATARDMARALEDEVPAVSATKIGEWVEATAKVAIGERQRLVEAVECDTAVQSSPGASAEDRSPARASAHAPRVESPTMTQDMVLTQLSSATAADSPHALAASKPRGRVVAIAGVALGVALVAVTAMRWRVGVAPSAGSVGASATTSAPSLAVASSSASPAASASATPAVATDAPSATASSSASAAPRRPPIPATTKPRPKAPDPYGRM